MAAAPALWLRPLRPARALAAVPATGSHVRCPRGLGARAGPHGCPAAPAPASGYEGLGTTFGVAFIVGLLGVGLRPHRGPYGVAGRRPLSRGDQLVVRGRNYEKNIKKQKGASEKLKLRRVARHLNDIILAVKQGGSPDPAVNTSLKRAMQIALKDNVSRSTIDGRIKKHVEGKEEVVELRLDGMGPGGIPFIVETVGSNAMKMRTEVKTTFKDCGGELGRDGSNNHFFSKQGVVVFEGVEEDDVMEASLEAEAEDCAATEDGSAVEVLTTPENFEAAMEVFEKQGLAPSSAKVEDRPLAPTEPSGETAYEVLRLLYSLDNLDDVQAVHCTAVIPEDVELRFNNYGQPVSWQWLQKNPQQAR